MAPVPVTAGENKIKYKTKSERAELGSKLFWKASAFAQNINTVALKSIPERLTMEPISFEISRVITSSMSCGCMC